MLRSIIDKVQHARKDEQCKQRDRNPKNERKIKIRNTVTKMSLMGGTWVAQSLSVCLRLRA